MLALPGALWTEGVVTARFAIFVLILTNVKTNINWFGLVLERLRMGSFAQASLKVVNCRQYEAEFEKLHKEQLFEIENRTGCQKPCRYQEYRLVCI